MAPSAADTTAGITAITIGPFLAAMAVFAHSVRIKRIVAAACAFAMRHARLHLPIFVVPSARRHSMRLNSFFGKIGNASDLSHTRHATYSRRPLQARHTETVSFNLAHSMIFVPSVMLF